ncbi:MAG: phosphinothricin acetyltransferase [Planctomycetes bacterium RBG_19FT_COMBO_48_8]|nr:MAG: phosphinothricin acetyltransferase [Planctomycetes bacterium RBG_13_46_10]OHB83534.1 MAG: phosphinothricin acetyltransferase [Planctomycetes bacterium RBG_19FT_COMBO_48_8]
MNFKVEKMKDQDAPAVKEIYQDGIDTGNATFESEAPEWKQWDKSHLRDCRIVAKSEGKIVGWVALSSVSERCAYRGVAEVSLYVKSSARGQGVGKALLKAVIEESERVGIWTLQAGTFPENVASLALQKACGFRIVGTREKIGCMNGQWRDVVLTERRSKVIGI